ncbi:permease [Thermohalobacter berrensis]|uniref:Permease n=1 Tax=Thermohalobacter berrensis TaxID=99594 RepID=A0A419T397_9FIRM|nr:permease [Thermohalobacter berrensis]RKD31925.1 permease [Thermohalobacter berrensis]
MTTIILILIAVISLLWSFIKDKAKTKKTLKISTKLFKNTFSEVFFIMALVALFLAWIPQSVIKTLLGSSNEIFSILLGAAIGTITIIPAFVAFPLAGSLLKSGSNLVAIAAFLTTLTMVGFATMPIEIKYFGKKFTLIRNGISIIAAILIAFGMGVIL